MKKLAIIFCLFTATISVEAGNWNIQGFYSWQEKEYKKIEDIDVPADVLKAASARYSGYALNEAYRAEDGEFKLILTKDNKPIVAYYKATGEFIKDETIK